MNYIDLGTWSAPTRAVSPDGIAFARYTDAAGEDWYAAVAHDPERPQGLAVALDDEGRVLFCADDVAHLEPSLKRVLVFPDWTGADKEALFGKRFDLETGEFVDPPVPLPTITRRQLRLWLVRNGIALATVEEAIAALSEPDRTEAQIEWADAQSYQFDNPLVAQIGTAIGMTIEQMELGWREAALI